MDRKLTAADQADYLVEITTTEGTQTRTIRAAYAIPEPGWLVFKDYAHRMVAQFNEHLVISVMRADELDTSFTCDGDRIRDAMTEAQDHPGRTITR